MTDYRFAFDMPPVRRLRRLALQPPGLPMDEQFSFTVRVRLPLRLRIPWQVSASSGRQRCLDLKLIMLGDHLLPTTSILGDSRKLTSQTFNQSNSSRICVLAPGITVIFPAPSAVRREHHGHSALITTPASGNLTSVECQNLLTTIYRISSFMLLQMFIGFLNSLYGDDAVTIPP